MDAISIFIIVAIIILILGWGIWFTVSKFKNIEEGETGRRKRIEEDMKVKNKDKDT